MSDLDTVRITGMRFWGKHGAEVGERERDQPIDVDVEISCDLTNAIAGDVLANTVDYASVYRTCEQIVTQQSFALLETLADRMSRTILEDPKVQAVIVRVRKPRLLDGATPEIELHRHRPVA